jgi:hypothetical protein
MKKIVPILIVGVLVLSGLGAVALPEENPEQLQDDTISLSPVVITEKETYLTVDLPEATSLHLDTGKPVLPVVTKVYTFPFGTDVEDVKVTFSDITTQVLSKQIEPAPQAVALLPSEALAAQEIETSIDHQVYQSTELYPSEQFTYRTGAGLKDKEHVIYLAVRCYPVQYAPVDNTIYVASNIDIDVTYTLPKHPIVFLDSYDMVIITPAKWESKLQALVDHKNDMGVATTIKTVEDIYSEYEGRDEPEDIKLFIKDAIETWGVEYVLLFGGRKGQTFKWHIPERITHNADINLVFPEPGYASDLYYADIYKNNGTEFEDWDSNGNGIFAEWTSTKKDYMDFVPDVYIGRITVRYNREVKRIINKIITYETTVDDSWFKKAVFIAGDTFPAPDSFYEGELENQKAIDSLEPAGFTIEKLWASLETLTGKSSVLKQYKPGAGILYFAGHGNPSTWSTHPPHDDEVWITGLDIFVMSRLKNKEKTPFVLVGGCHNAQFNATMSLILKDIKKYGFASYFGFGENPSSRFFYFEWVPHDWCSWQVLKKDGGAIGAVGNAALGYGYSGSATTEGLGGWLDPQHFICYAEKGAETLGEMHGQAITDYINIIGNVNSDNIDRKTIDCSILIGDPSLKLGG